MGFMRAKTTGFTAIYPTPFSYRTLGVVRDDQYVNIFEGSISDRATTADLAGAGVTMPEPFRSCMDGIFGRVDAAGDVHTIYLAGDLCLDYGFSAGLGYSGPVTGLPGFGEYLPAAYRSDIDLALPVYIYAQASPTQILLFKGDRCALIEWGTRLVYEGPLAGMPDAGWKQLPPGMASDFDHATNIEKEGGWPHQTLFVKGDRAMDFHWDTGPAKVGTYAEVNAQLGALPADYQQLRLPPAGRFLGTSGIWKIDLRIDLAGALPVVSGDLFATVNGADVYQNSFVLDAARAAALPGPITGAAAFAFPNWMARASVASVDRLAPGGTATVDVTTADPASGLRFVCSYTSRFLRTVDWEIDYVTGTELPAQYATTQDPRPPGLAKRIMTVQAAYADAGVEVRTAGVPNLVPLTGAGANLAWSDAELHAAMAANFSFHRDVPQWKLWTLIANRHETAGEADRNDGIMFDWSGAGPGGGPQRQGMAIFYDTAREAGYVGRREGLFSYIHEIGHALNMQHSWQKQPEQARGPQGGMADLSFMNYAENYPGAQTAAAREAAFYAAFVWQFTPSELRHIRHGFYYNIVPGGNAYGAGSAHATAGQSPAAQDPAHTPALDDSALPVQASPPVQSAPLADTAPPAPSQSGLRLDLSGSAAFSYGEPVTTQITLSLDGTTPTAEATPSISPGGGNLTVLITDPAGNTRLFTPIASACGDYRRVTLDATTPALYDSAYLGYGADGLTFTQPGTYHLQARYTAPDGSVLASPDHVIQVSPPVDDADKAAGDLLTGDQQGTLLALLGSDAPQLADGNAALDTLITDHPQHPLTVFALMAKGTNAGRHFHTLTPDGITVRPPDTTTSIHDLTQVVDTTLNAATPDGVDNITLNQTMRTLALAYADAGDLKDADATLDHLVQVFRDKNVPAPVLATITQEADTTRTQIHAQP
jgi:hypothetical protein